MTSITIGLLFAFLGAIFASDPDIVIIGAGASGISTATALIKHNLKNILILEAESYVGGRVRTIKFNGTKNSDSSSSSSESSSSETNEKFFSKDDKYLEFGAEWVMGGKGNVIYDLAERNNLIGPTIEDNPVYCFTSSGERIPERKINEYWAEYDAILEKVKLSNKTVEEAFNEEVTTEKYGDKVEMVQKFFKMLFESITPVTRWQNEIGAGLSSYKVIDGSTAISVKGGMAKIVDVLMVGNIFTKA